MSDSLSAADGRWPEILSSLGSVSLDQLTDKHQPCPACGGTDRFRWDDDAGAGAWFCNQCGGKDRSGGGGNGLDLLMRVCGWDFRTAVSRVERYLGLDSSRPPLVDSRPQPAKEPSRASLPPADVKPPSLGKASVQYRYADADGRTLFFVQRFDKGDGRKLFVHRTWVDGDWHFPRKTDGFDSAWPVPRPLYRLETLARMPYADIVLVEGEKAADVAARLLPDYAVLSWPNGSKAVDKVDFAPLAGRFVHLWPDNDAPGRKAMDAVGRKLLDLGCSVKLVANPSNAREGWDVADAVWTPAETLDHLLANLSDFAPSGPVDPPTRRATSPEEGSDEAPFELLGFSGNSDYYYLPRSLGRVIKLSSAGHTSNNLCRLADVHYWQEGFPGARGAVDWTAAVSWLYATQHAVGEFDPDLLRGRGAWWDAGRSILHLGDRLVVDGAEIPIHKRLRSRFHYQRGLPLARLGGVEPLSDAEAFEVVDLAEQFYWDRPASALLLAGWCALAPVCGSLPWRPHVWLTAGAGTGKTAILERFVSPLLGELQLVTQGSTTEAFIRQHLKVDALPVVMDEAESYQRGDATRMQQILALARQASSETRAVQGRGSPSGDTQVYRIRSMFLLASIATAVKQGADDRRFTQLTLKKPPNVNPTHEAERWTFLKRRLESTLTEEFAQRLLARTVSLIPVIRETISVFCEVAAGHFGSQATGDQYGVLLAGAWHLSSSLPASAEDARGMIASADWEVYADNENVLPDEEACLQLLLQSHLRVQSSDRQAVDRTVLELVEICHRPYSISPLSPFLPEDAAAALGREGLRVADGRLLVGNTASGVARVLRDTPWSSNWGTVLSRLQGAHRGTGPAWFSGAGTMRYVSIPIEACSVRPESPAAEGISADLDAS